MLSRGGSWAGLRDTVSLYNVLLSTDDVVVLSAALTLPTTAEEKE